jgi:hypothetical protein
MALATLESRQTNITSKQRRKLLLKKFEQDKAERRVLKYSRIFRRRFKTLIEDQEARVLQMLTTLPPDKKRIARSDIFDFTTENKYLAEGMRSVYIQTQTDSAEELMDKFNIFVKAVRPEKLLQQKVFDYADKYSVAMAKYVNQTTAKKIQQVAIESMKEGKTYAQVGKDLSSKVFPQLKDGYRAKMTARTEVHGMVENGSYEAAKASNVVKTKEWSAAYGARPTHSEANTQVVGIDEHFIVGGYEMRYPGDASLGADAGEIINCRCSVLYGTEKRELSDKGSKKPSTSAAQSGATFKEAKTIEEAQDFAKRNIGIERVRYKDLRLTHANEINRTLIDLKKAYNFDLRAITTRKDGNYLFQISTKSYKGEIRNTLEINLEMVNRFRSQESFAKMAMNNYDKGFWASKNLGDVLTHEIGHALTVRRGLSTKAFNRIIDTLEKTKLPKISTYGSTNGVEGLAEWFVAYSRGDKVPAEVASLLKKYMGVTKPMT